MRKFRKIKCGLILPIVVFCAAVFTDQLQAGASANSAQPEALFSPAASKKLYELAYDLANSDNVAYVQNEQAITFLLAAMNLDKDSSSDVLSLLLKCACRFPEQHSLQKIAEGRNYFDLVYTLLQQYVDENADIDVASNAVSYLLGQAGSPEQKQTLLQQMLGIFAGKNPAFESELATRLGLLKIQAKSPEDAEKYFRQAYQKDKNNKFAFSKLVELTPQQVSPSEYIERLRLDLRENPMDVQTVLAFCQSCEQMQLYDTAADAYEYCSELFEYLYPSQPLPPDIYIPWSISCYNSPRRQFKCLQIAETISRTGKFDLRLESLSGRAASKLGEDQAAAQILRDAEMKALELVNNNSPDITAAHLAWFYNFVIPMPAKAIEWSNKAFSTDPNSPLTASLLAYALTQNREFSSAMSLINNFEHNQISDLALAQVQLEEGQAVQGIESLNRAISKDPGSFAAERAKAILAQNGEKYAPSVNPDSLKGDLANIFGSKLVPEFTPPEKMFAASFNIRNKELSFGSDLNCVISIANNSSEPLVISNDSMFQGNIRIDAVVSGDINKTISNLVSGKIRNTKAIEPGKSKIINVKLLTGELRDMLMTHPQASLNISFILYLDPVQTIEDRVTNRLKSIAPVSVTVTRPGIVITGSYLRDLVDSLSFNQEGQKILSGQIFIGLLKEQNAFAGRTATYRAVFTDGMNTMLKSALIKDSGLLHNPDNGGWVVKLCTMAEMLDIPLDFELVQVVAKNLYNEKWPVRMMALYVLAESQGKNFDKVLEGLSQTDQNQLVKDIAGIEMQKIRSVTGQSRLQ